MPISEVNGKRVTSNIELAMDEYAKLQSIGFAEWIDGQQLECDLMTDDGVKHWCYMYPKGTGKESFTTKELYSLYLTQQK